MFPFIDTAPRAARPLIVLGLIGVNTLVFLWMWMLSPGELDQVLVRYALVPVRYTHPTLALRVGLDPTDYWPLITGTFMHGGWLHLVLNMWFLWIFGPAMEGRLGRLGFTALYFAGGAAASLVHLFTHPDSPTPVIGASGAIAAVIGAYAVTFPTARVISIVLLGFIPLFLPIPAILFALVWIGLQLLQGSIELAAPNLAASVAWWAHIGGFAFGAAVAMGMRVSGLSAGTPTTVWTDTRGKRVPDIRPRNLDER